MSQPALTIRMPDDLRTVLELNMQMAGFSSRAAYMKYLLRKEAAKDAPVDLAALVERAAGEERQDDFDSAPLRIAEAPEANRAGLLALLGSALSAALNPRNRSDLRLRTSFGGENPDHSGREAA